MGREYEGKVYKKGWGKEAQIYSSDRLGIWLLQINKGQKTSLHAHPNKKTILINLGGVIRVHFLNDSKLFAPSEGLNIHKGVFHRTEAITDNCYVLEVESPNNKSDLLRLDDLYGRIAKPIEGDEAIINGEQPFELHPDGYNIIGECRVYFNVLLNKASIFDLIGYVDKVIILEGRLHRQGIAAIGPADLTDPKTFARLAENLDFDGPIKILQICKKL